MTARELARAQALAAKADTGDRGASAALRDLTSGILSDPKRHRQFHKKK